MDKPLLDLYADYLIASFGPTTATGLSRLLDAHLSHDKITRFLSERPYTSANLWQIVKPLVRQVQTEEAVLVIDDSITHKPHTDPSELIGWHYDHTTGTTVKGINFLTTLYCTEEVSLPVSFALVEKDEEFTDPKTGKSKRRATTSKNEHYRTMLRACLKNQMPFRYVLNDIWFAAADNMKMIKTELGKDFVMPLTPIKPQVQPQGGPVGPGQKRWMLSGSRNTLTRTWSGTGGIPGTGAFRAAAGAAGLYEQRRQPGRVVSGEQRHDT